MIAEEVEHRLRDVSPEDLLSFGLIPEFVGRLPVVSTLQNLTRDQLIRILTEPKNAMVKQYSKLLAMDGVEFEIKDRTVSKRWRIRPWNGGPAPGLFRSIFEKLMLDVMFESPSSDELLMRGSRSRRGRGHQGGSHGSEGEKGRRLKIGGRPRIPPQDRSGKIETLR